MFEMCRGLLIRRRRLPAVCLCVLVLCAMGADAPAVSVKHLHAELVSVDETQIVTCAKFSISQGQQRWFWVYLGVRLSDSEYLKGSDGKDFIRPWGQLFPAANHETALYDDVRMPIKRADLDAAKGLPKGKRTVLWVVCDIWDQTAKKYIDNGWKTRTPLIVTTDADGKIAKIETFNTDARDARVDHRTAKIKAYKCNVKTKHLKLRPQTTLHRAVDVRNDIYDILRRDGLRCDLGRASDRGLFFEKVDTPEKARDLALVGSSHSVIIKTPHQYVSLVKALKAKGWEGTAVAQPPAFGVSVKAEPGLGYRVQATTIAYNHALKKLQHVVVDEFNITYDGHFGKKRTFLIRAPRPPFGVPMGYRPPKIDYEDFDKILRGALTGDGSEPVPGFVEVTKEVVTIPVDQDGMRPDMFKDLSRPDE